MKWVHVRLEQNHMATTFDFRISCESSNGANSARAGLAERILTDAHQQVAQLEKEISEYLPESPIYQLNRAAPLELIKMTPSAIDLLERSEKLRTDTQGAFSCTAKSTSNMAKSDRARVGWSRGTLRAWRIDEGAWVGFGAIGKGYALDQVRKLIEAHGFQDYLLSAGGSSIILSGFAGPGEPWKWGWSWKKDSEQNHLGIQFAHFTGASVAIGVSGLHEKGKHLIDPRSGSQADGQSSALVGHPSATDADALSTALFVSGWENGIKMMQKLPVSPALASIEQDGAPRWNGIFQRFWGPCQTAMLILIPLLGPFLGLKSAHADDAVDLGSMGLDSFTPYLVDRNKFWALLPILSIGVVLIHLKKVRRRIMKHHIRTHLSILLTSLLLWSSIEAQAVEIEPKGKAIAHALGTTKAFSKTLEVGRKKVTFFYSKAPNGKARRLAFVQQGVYPPNCTHTWVIGLDAATGKVAEVRAVEMSCPHAFPCKEESFLDQYKGKGPADIEKLSGDISTVAKATGTSNLTTDAVKKTLTEYKSIKGKI